MDVIFTPEMKLILLLLSLTISTIPANANEDTRAKVKNYKQLCIIGIIESDSFYDKFVLVNDVRRKCSCVANNVVQGLDADECKPPKVITKDAADKHFSWN